MESRIADEYARLAHRQNQSRNACHMDGGGTLEWWRRLSRKARKRLLGECRFRRERECWTWRAGREIWQFRWQGKGWRSPGWTSRQICWNKGAHERWKRD